MAVKRAIALYGPPTIVEDWGNALEAITPGHLVELAATGVQKQTDDAANVAAAFALEREEMGKDIDAAYAVGDQVKVGVFAPGQRALGWIASGANIAKGAYLTSDTAGRLTATGVAAGVRLALALEAVNNSAGPGDARIRVQIV